MLQHSIQKHTLHFKQPSGTSRGVLRTKDSWYIKLWDPSAASTVGIGECSIINGLSPDPIDLLEDTLHDLMWTDSGLSSHGENIIRKFPAIQFAVEMARIDLEQGGRRILFPSTFTEGDTHIDINGLIWMGDRQFMKDQIRTKIDQGYRCVKMKIGAIDFQSELDILNGIRSEFSQDDIELRVDANGAFSSKEALDKLQCLAKYDLHSIEQPIRQGQIESLARICASTPLPIALDEELLNVYDRASREALLSEIKPHYIILKPSLVGGFANAHQWIEIAETNNVGWWITSALESNIGLNAIAQWTATLGSPMFQGLGTGQLFTNNIKAPLRLDGDKMFYEPKLDWEVI